MRCAERSHIRFVVSGKWEGANETISAYKIEITLEVENRLSLNQQQMR